MNNDIFLLDIPDFNPEYEQGTYYAYKGKGGENLKNLLTKTSGGYCMYCYAKIVVDRKNYGELEHTVEKVNSDRLYNCPSNISIACSKCNGSFKKKDENKRRLTKDEKYDFERKCECSADCIKLCEPYNMIRDIVKSKPGGKIIFQPYGTKNTATGNQYAIQYDLLKQKFIASNKYEYSSEEKNFIEAHIQRFNLNDPEYRTKEILKFCEDVLEYHIIPKCGRYENMIVDLFIERLHKISLEESIKVCGMIYSFAVLMSK